MSKIKNFNDPFDSYVSFSMEAAIGKIVAKSLSNQSFNSSVVEESIPLLVEGILNDGFTEDEQSPNLSYLLEIMEDIPELLKCGGFDRGTKNSGNGENDGENFPRWDKRKSGNK